MGRMSFGMRRFVVAVAVALVAMALAPVPTAYAAAPRTLYLVTLAGPGTAGYAGQLPTWVQAAALMAQQQRVMQEVDAEPVYQWTAALNGFAAELTHDQAAALRRDDRVVLVEKNTVRPLAGAPDAGAGLNQAPTARGGAGVVVGLVDTGIWPGSPLFAKVPGLGRGPRDFRGACVAGAGWAADDCNGKLVGARWFVAGFGEDAVRTSSSLSPLDDSGHGTQMASIAAGNSGVTVQVPGQRLGRYGGIAPQARIAVYKACWTAPDPADDGCATADLVTAIDRATSDGVDVLNLAVGGPSTIDTVERALLGAAERDVVVVAAAGNAGHTRYAAHPSPWVTSVGGTTGDERRGQVVLPGGDRLDGAMAATRRVGPARLVVGARVPAADSTPAASRICRPGSLDASRTEGRVVVCERGGIGRVIKSDAVRQADGVGMVLVNVRPGRVESDLHAVPAVHLGASDARALRRWHVRHPHAKVTLVPRGVHRATPVVAHWSSTGDPTGATVKPDLVGPAVGALGAVPPSVRSTRWDFVTGTSAAAAWVSGQALRLRASHPDWSADQVRSALVTAAASVAGGASALAEGAGRPRAAAADGASLAYLAAPHTYRSWLSGHHHRDLNVPSVLLSGGRDRAVRRITNVGGRPATFSAVVTGLTRHRAVVRPATVRLAPGESATFRMRVSGAERAVPLDDGWLTWTSGDGTRNRIPLVITR
jgi:hypothetical protein